MSSGNFSSPTSVSYGPGCREELTQALDGLKVKKPLLVTDPGLLTAGTGSEAGRIS